MSESKIRAGIIPPSQKGAIPWNKGKKGLQKSKFKGISRPRFSGKNHPMYGKKQKFSGEKHPNWKGGITPINERIRRSLEYKLWRIAIFERDDYTCVWCGIKNGLGKTVILNADHIKPFAFYPELRFAIDNGRTLCKDCHKKTNTYGRR